MNQIYKFLIIFSVLVCAETKAETVNYNLPPISSLPPVKIPSFKKQHPRLPAPKANEIKKLEKYNSLFLKRHKNKAANGHLYSRILIAYIYPEKATLDNLYADLTRLKFTDRGDKHI